MLKEERQALILNKFHSFGKVAVSRLAVELSVSEGTIRRDLLNLGQRRQVKRMFDGAISMERPVINFFDWETTDAELRQHLVLKALDFLEKDQLVVIGSNNTNLQFAKNIPNGLKLAVLANSYPITHACSMKDQVDVIVLGERLLRKSMTSVGKTAASQAALYHPDLCSMGIYVIHPEYGITISYPDEVSIKRQLIQSLRRVIALVNPIKPNTVSRYHVCGIEAFTTLITDNGVSGEVATDYRNKRLDLLQSGQVPHKTCCDLLRYFCGISFVFRRSSVYVLTKIAYQRIFLQQFVWHNMYIRYNTLRDRKEAGRRACSARFRRVFAMKFSTDTVNIEDIKRANDMGIICDVTTNPSLITKEGGNFVGVIREVTDIVDGPINGRVRVTTADAEGMVREGRKIAAIHPSMVVKTPMIAEGLKAIKALHAGGIKTNVILVFTPAQALLAARTGASCVSLFLGRLDNISMPDIDLIYDVTEVFQMYSIEAEIIAASAHNPIHVIDCTKAGADTVTVPYRILEQMTEYPLTGQGIAKFQADYETVFGG